MGHCSTTALPPRHPTLEHPRTSPRPHAHHHCAPGAVPTSPHAPTGSPHTAPRRHPGSARPPPGAASLCAQWDAARTRTIHTWLEQIPRWLHSFPCILFTLPGPRGHFPFPPAFPLPARLISLSWPCSPTPRRSRPTAAPSHWHPSLPALTASSLLCSSNQPSPGCNVSVASGGQLKRQSVKNQGASAAQLDRILEEIVSERNRALVPAGACDGTENPLYASVRSAKGKRKVT